MNSVEHKRVTFNCCLFRSRMDASVNFNYTILTPCRSAGAIAAQRRWPTFLITSLASPFILGLPVFIYKWTTRNLTIKIPYTRRYLLQAKNLKEYDPMDIDWSDDATFAAAGWVSDQTTVGQGLKIAGILCAVGSLVIYFHDTSKHCIDVEICHLWTLNHWWQADLAFNFYFLFYYILRFTGARRDKLAFIFSLEACVEYLTVPPCFVAVALDRNWYGLRFFRIYNTLWLIDLLHRFNITRKSHHVRLARLIAYIVVAVIVGAGFLLLLECAGDPWTDNTDRIAGNTSDEDTFWNFAYFAVVTLTTVGYGDIKPQTVLGKVFTTVFIIVCVGFIASFLASIASLLPRPKRHPEFDRENYFNHIIVCGSITFKSAEKFITEFYNDAKPKGIEELFVIFLHPDEPDDDLALLLTDYQACVEYIQGTPSRDEDLEKCRAKHASACIFLANQNAVDPRSEDGHLVLNIVAVKNYCPTLRVLVQVLRSSTMIFLKNCSFISLQTGDLVTCQKSIEGGLIGMNCLVPGFTALFCNLLWKPRGIPKSLDLTNVPDLYIRGSQCHLTCVRFSCSFYGMTFPDAVRVAFEKLDILLIGIYTRGQTSVEYRNVIPNPASKFVIVDGIMAHVIALSDAHAHKLEIYCRECHGDVNARASIALTPCQCGRSMCTYQPVVVTSHMEVSGMEMKKVISTEAPLVSPSEMQLTVSPDYEFPLEEVATVASDVALTGTPSKPAQALDSSGMFYWCRPRSFDSCVMTHEEAALQSMSGHIVIFILDNPEGTSPGLHHIILPLRASVIAPADLRKVVVVGVLDKIRGDWKRINMLPDITFIGGDPMLPSVIRASQVHSCHCAVIISPGIDATNAQDQDTIVQVLRLRSTKFTMQIRGRNRSLLYKAGEDLPLIILFDDEEHIRFISQVNSRTDYHYTVPYMSGQVLASSSLESLMIPAYYHPSLMHLLSCLVFGGSSSELAHMRPDGMSLTGPLQNKGPKERSHLKTTLTIWPMTDDKISAYIDQPYGSLFIYALENNLGICLGLYRLLETHYASPELSPRNGLWGKATRFVATSPPRDTIILASDGVYILLPATIT